MPRPVATPAEQNSRPTGEEPTRCRTAGRARAGRNVTATRPFGWLSFAGAASGEPVRGSLPPQACRNPAHARRGLTLAQELHGTDSAVSGEIRWLEGAYFIISGEI